MKWTCGSSPEEGCVKGRGEGLLPCKDPEVNGDIEWKKALFGGGLKDWIKISMSGVIIQVT